MVYLFNVFEVKSKSCYTKKKYVFWKKKQNNETNSLRAIMVNSH